MSYESTIRIENDDSAVAVTIGDDDLPGRHDGHGRWHAKVRSIATWYKTLPEYQTRFQFAHAEAFAFWILYFAGVKKKEKKCYCTFTTMVKTKNIKDGILCGIV